MIGFETCMYMGALDICILSLDDYVQAMLMSIEDEYTMELKPNLDSRMFFLG